MNEEDVLAEILDAITCFYDTQDELVEMYANVYPAGDHFTEWENLFDGRLHITTKQGRTFLVRVERVEEG